MLFYECRPKGRSFLLDRVFDKAFWKSYTYFNLTMQGAAKQHERMYARLFKLWRKLPEQAERSR